MQCLCWGKAMGMRCTLRPDSSPRFGGGGLHVKASHTTVEDPEGCQSPSIIHSCTSAGDRGKERREEEEREREEGERGGRKDESRWGHQGLGRLEDSEKPSGCQMSGDLPDAICCSATLRKRRKITSVLYFSQAFLCLQSQRANAGI